MLRAQLKFIVIWTLSKVTFRSSQTPFKEGGGEGGSIVSCRVYFSIIALIAWNLVGIFIGSSTNMTYIKISKFRATI